MFESAAINRYLAARHGRFTVLARGPGRPRPGRHVGRMGQDHAAAELPPPGVLAGPPRQRSPTPPARAHPLRAQPRHPRGPARRRPLVRSAPTSPSPTSRSASPLYRYFTSDLESPRAPARSPPTTPASTERPAYAEHVMVNYDILRQRPDAGRLRHRRLRLGRLAPSPTASARPATRSSSSNMAAATGARSSRCRRRSPTR